MNPSIVDIEIPYNGVTLKFTGGPYRDRPTSSVGVCMLPELPRGKTADIHVPTRDFTPPPEDEFLAGVEEAVRQALKGKTVYVGCTAGIGRTGTFLAGVAKVAGYNEPVSYIRANFKRHAVETRPQEELVSNMDALSIQKSLKYAFIIARVRTIFQGWMNDALSK